MFWNYQQLKKMDFKLVLVIFALMTMSLVILSIVYFSSEVDISEVSFFTPLVKKQLQYFFIGWLVYLFFSGFDYNKLREWAWIMYLITLLALIGLFFTNPIQGVYRWYRIPGLGFHAQPSELAKLVVVIALSWFLERRKSQSKQLSAVIGASIIVGIPFLMILKQPDLGTALILYPITLVIFYFAGVSSWVIRAMSIAGVFALCIVLTIFLGFLSHEDLKPVATSFLKDYQYERLNPNTHHQKAATTAIALGGIKGAGFRSGAFTGGGWLPAPFTDSVFSNFAEHFGFLGLFLMLSLFYALIYLSFRISAVAKDHFGKLLSAGVAVYLAMHILVNIGMMCGLLPITGVPLILLTYGGSSTLATMAALGILQNIYSQRFMF